MRVALVKLTACYKEIMIYKNKHNELWCECGNRIHIYGFHPADKEGKYTNSDGSGKNDKYWKCDKCGAKISINLDRVKTAQEPEVLRLIV